MAAVCSRSNVVFSVGASQLCTYSLQDRLRKNDDGSPINQVIEFSFYYDFLTITFESECQRSLFWPIAGLSTDQKSLIYHFYYKIDDF